MYTSYIAIKSCQICVLLYIQLVRRHIDTHVSCTYVPYRCSPVRNPDFAQAPMVSVADSLLWTQTKRELTLASLWRMTRAFPAEKPSPASSASTDSAREACPVAGYPAGRPRQQPYPLSLYTYLSTYLPAGLENSQSADEKSR